MVVADGEICAIQSGKVKVICCCPVHDRYSARIDCSILLLRDDRKARGTKSTVLCREKGCGDYGGGYGSPHWIVQVESTMVRCLLSLGVLYRNAVEWKGANDWGDQDIWRKESHG